MFLHLHQCCVSKMSFLSVFCYICWPKTVRKNECLKRYDDAAVLTKITKLQSNYWQYMFLYIFITCYVQQCMKSVAEQILLKSIKHALTYRPFPEELHFELTDVVEALLVHEHKICSTLYYNVKKKKKKQTRQSWLHCLMFRKFASANHTADDVNITSKPILHKVWSVY